MRLGVHIIQNRSVLLFLNRITINFRRKQVVKVARPKADKASVQRAEKAGSLEGSVWSKVDPYDKDILLIKIKVINCIAK